MQKHVLVVEDEAPIRDMIKFALTRAGFAVSEAPDAQSARLAVADRRPDLVLLDWMLPGVSGLELARQWRRAELTRNMPVILVTARIEENDRVRGLNLGADDYVTKPFDLKEIEARIRAVLRRRRTDDENQADHALLAVGPLTIEDRAKEVLLAGYPLRLSPKEYTLLHLLCSEPDTVFETETISEAVWPERDDATAEDVKTYVYLLRTKLTKASQKAGVSAPCIENVRGFGYRIRSHRMQRLGAHDVSV